MARRHADECGGITCLPSTKATKVYTPVAVEREKRDEGACKHKRRKGKSQEGAGVPLRDPNDDNNIRLMDRRQKREMGGSPARGEKHKTVKEKEGHCKGEKKPQGQTD